MHIKHEGVVKISDESTIKVTFWHFLGCHTLFEHDQLTDMVLLLLTLNTFHTLL